MNRRQLVFLLVAACCLIAFSPSRSQAEVNLSINIGPAPVCPYGYYGYAPYSCAPYGYYGPTWFVNGVFIGAGPWYRGPRVYYVNPWRYGYGGVYYHRFYHHYWRRDGDWGHWHGHGHWRGHGYGHWRGHGHWRHH